MNKLEAVAAIGGAIGIVSGISCGNNGNQNQEITPTPCPTAPDTQTPTSEFNRGLAFAKMPQVPCEYLASWESAVGFLSQLKKDEGLTRLVQDERGSIDVYNSTGFENSTPTKDPLLAVTINVQHIKDTLIDQNPTSTPSQSDIKTGIMNMQDKICLEIAKAVSPLKLLYIVWDVTSVDGKPGVNRNILADEYGFTPEQIARFKRLPTDADCLAA